MYFDVEKTLGMSSYQIWNKVHLIQSSQSLIDGTHWFWARELLFFMG